MLTSTGIGMPWPRRSTRFSAVMQRHAASGRQGDDLLAEQCPSPALDHPELRIDLVGTVQVDVEPFDLVEVAERDLQAAGQLGGLRAGRRRR